MTGRKGHCGMEGGRFEEIKPNRASEAPLRRSKTTVMTHRRRHHVTRLDDLRVATVDGGTSTQSRSQ